MLLTVNVPSMSNMMPAQNRAHWSAVPVAKWRRRVSCRQRRWESGIPSPCAQVPLAFGVGGWCVGGCSMPTSHPSPSGPRPTAVNQRRLHSWQRRHHARRRRRRCCIASASPDLPPRAGPAATAGADVQMQAAAVGLPGGSLASAPLRNAGDGARHAANFYGKLRPHGCERRCYRASQAAAREESELYWG